MNGNIRPLTDDCLGATGDVYVSDTPVWLGVAAVEHSGWDEFGRPRLTPGVFVRPDSVRVIGALVECRAGEETWTLDPDYWNYRNVDREGDARRFAAALGVGLLVGSYSHVDFRVADAAGRYRVEYRYTPEEEQVVQSWRRQVAEAVGERDPLPIVAAQEGSVFVPGITPP